MLTGWVRNRHVQIGSPAVPGTITPVRGGADRRRARGRRRLRLAAQRTEKTVSENFRVTIYHNPDCGTSRNVLAMIHAAG
jgi:hypothetical protein